MPIFLVNGVIFGLWFVIFKPLLDNIFSNLPKKLSKEARIFHYV